jgi:hypothetical protein
MKRILLLVSLLGCLGYLMATPGPGHKVNWCHYPPGQWTGVTGSASHVLILSIDVAAEPGHLGHSPSLTGGPACDPSTFNGTTASGCAEGVTLTGDASGCPGSDPPAPSACTSETVCALETAGTCTGGTVNLIQGPLVVPGVGTIGTGGNACVCPAGTNNAGSTPFTFAGGSACGSVG